MDFDSAFAYLESFSNLERLPGGSMRPYRLDRMEVLLELFGNPQNKFSSIHISGSKGKGSTGCYIACILKDAGFKTGLYASPHVHSYRERINLAGDPFPDELLVEIITGIRQIIETLPPGTLPGQDRPTTFELLTLLSYLAFERAGVTWAVVETGIGGRLDATNVLSPKATVHTPVELEHTDVLGDTIEKIAAEKAGIIKPGTPAYCGLQRPEAMAVFAQKARSVGVPFIELAKEIPRIEVSRNAGGFSGLLTLKNGDQFEIAPGMLGAFQVENAALAFLVTESLLASLGFSEDRRRKTIRSAIARAKLPGRMEIINDKPPVMIDAAHTPSSTARLAEAYSAMFPPGGILLFGSVLGKNPEAMAKVLSPHFSKVIISTPGTFKMSDPQSVYHAFNGFHRSVELIRDPKAALSRVLELAGADTPILVTGSFYMIAEIRKLFPMQSYRKVG
ncbi:MAG: bifunctional folylpolyglutamate synthase/dihydrofolate synthase [Spirochaetales bacterium]|nr:bifunctional folylpolyglutamate synthase/dihydrofolate synthase [Spirochaetales bacterium]